MPLEDKFPAMSDTELATLLDNVNRLTHAGSDKQKVEAGRLHPLVAAEIADRKAKAPPKKTVAKAKSAKA